MLGLVHFGSLGPSLESLIDLNPCSAGPDLVIFTVPLQTAAKHNNFILVAVELLNLSARELIQVVGRVT